MRKFKMKLLACMLIALCAMSPLSMYMPVNAAGLVEPYIAENPVFTFTGKASVAYHCDGMWLTVKLRALAANDNNETVTFEIDVLKTGATKTYTFYTSGEEYKYENIFLGFDGGSDVWFNFTGANPEIKIAVTMDITSYY